jgi:CheY-like chemotaxis protein
MTERTLANRHVLVVEDDFFIAEDLTQALEACGAVVVGPVPTVRDALKLFERGERIDGAVLDLNLRGEKAFPICDALMNRQIPLVLTTGYDGSEIPERYRALPRCEKPADPAKIVRALFG